MQVQRVGLDAVQLAVTTLLRLSLVEVGLGPGLAVELLDLVSVNIEQVAVVRLLVTRSEASKDDHVVLTDLEESAALEADPVRVLFDLQVQGLPVVSFS